MSKGIIYIMKKIINANIFGDPESNEFLVDNGQFKAIGNDLNNADEVIDLKGCLVLPPYVDPHLHLDYIFSGLGEGNANVSGTLFEGIQRWSDNKKSLTEEMVRARAIKGIQKELNHGAQFIRTHVDITDPNLTRMIALIKLREELNEIVTLQVVAFSQDSIADYWYPLGNGNRMNILDNVIHLAHYTHIGEINKAFDLITYHGANLMRVNNEYGIEVGKPANFIVLDAQDPYEAIRERAEIIASIRNGKYLFRREPRKNETEIDFLNTKQDSLIITKGFILLDTHIEGIFYVAS